MLSILGNVGGRRGPSRRELLKVGAVSLAMGTAVRVRTWRAAHARYWQGR